MHHCHQISKTSFASLSSLHKYSNRSLKNRRGLVTIIFLLPFDIRTVELTIIITYFILWMGFYYFSRRNENKRVKEWNKIDRLWCNSIGSLTHKLHRFHNFCLSFKHIFTIWNDGVRALTYTYIVDAWHVYVYVLTTTSYNCFFLCTSSKLYADDC